MTVMVAPVIRRSATGTAPCPHTLPVAVIPVAIVAVVGSVLVRRGSERRSVDDLHPEEHNGQL